MRNVLFALLIVASALAVFAGPVAGQEQANATEEDQPDSALEAIDSETSIESTEFVDGELEIVLVSDGTQRVTITDAGAVWEDGPVPQRDAILRTGRNSVTMPVTEVSNHVAVTIATDELLYSKAVRTSDPIIGGPYDEQDAQLAAVGGGLGILVVTVGLGIKRVHGVGSGPERIL